MMKLVAISSAEGFSFLKVGLCVDQHFYIENKKALTICGLDFDRVWEECKLRVASCELRVASCELRVASCELRVASCELQLRVASCQRRVAC